LPIKLINFLRGIHFLIAIIILSTSCSEYGHVVKKGTLTEKYDYALKAYKKNDFVRALPLFEDLLAVYRGQAKSEEIYYYYSYCYYGQGQYELAAYHFKNFTENYFNSKHLEECAYMYTKCLYKEALPYFLDQTNTNKAIQETQLFLNLYPKTKFKEECNNQIKELRASLHKKAFETGYLFYKIEDYRAAMISFKNAVKTYPDIADRDYIEFLVLKAAHQYAKLSIDEKKIDRYEDVFKEYQNFIKYNKSSKYIKQAEEIRTKANEELIKYKKINKLI
jgi:outer membrane protein assembly factor BamD